MAARESLRCYDSDEWEALAKAAAKRVPQEKTKALRDTLRLLQGKGWETGSIIVGFAIGVGLSIDESLALANETRYPLGKLG